MALRHNMQEKGLTKVEQTFICERCEQETPIRMLYDHDLCEPCYEWCYCECGRRLEDYWGQPGDGFCVKCR